MGPKKGRKTGIADFQGGKRDNERGSKPMPTKGVTAKKKKKRECQTCTKKERGLHGKKVQGGRGKDIQHLLRTKKKHSPSPGKEPKKKGGKKPYCACRERETSYFSALKKK